VTAAGASAAGEGSPRPAAAAGDELRVEVLRRSDLVESAAFAQRSGLTLEQIRSMRAHPHGKPEDCAGFILLRGNTRVARVGVLPGRLALGDRELRVFWGSANWEYDGDPRNRAGAGLLYLVAIKEAGTFCGSGASDSSRPILSAARFEFLPVPRRVMYLRAAPHLRRRLSSELAIGLIAAAVTPALRAVAALPRLTARLLRGRFRLDSADRFDEQVTEVEARARPRHGFLRDHRELNWVLDHPWVVDGDYRYRAFHLHSSGAIVGYGLLRLRRFAGIQLATIHRCGARADVPLANTALLASLLTAAADEGADLVELSTTRSDLLRAARQVGMIERPALEVACKWGGEPGRVMRASGVRFADFEAFASEGDVIFT
jgi:hypothetical protein